MMTALTARAERHSVKAMKLTLTHLLAVSVLRYLCASNRNSRIDPYKLIRGTKVNARALAIFYTNFNSQRASLNMEPMTIKAQFGAS